MNLQSAELMERELKFRAGICSVEKFYKLGQELGGRFVLGAGADCYYINPSQPSLPPVRHRYSQGYGELTAKQQTSPGSNVARKEVNVRLDDAQCREMEALLPMMGYVPALQVSKVSHIFFLDSVVLSWYSVLGMDGQLLYMKDGTPAQFVEVELREDIDWRSVTHIQNLVPKGTDCNVLFLTTEALCTWVLESWGAFLESEGIIRQPPIEKSLWEMFGEGK